MTDGDIKQEILCFLAKVRRKEGPDKRSDLTSLANELGMDIDEFSSKYLMDLYTHFLVDIHTVPGHLAVTITSDGLDYLAQSDDSI